MPDTTPSDVRPAARDECTVEFYETEDGVVFYDAGNPLAWIQARTTLPIEGMR